MATTASTIGLKNVVYAALTSDTEDGAVYGTVNTLAGAIEATVTPENTDPDVQYADDAEFDVLYPDPEITLSLEMADIPIEVQADLLGNTLDSNGVLLRGASDKPDYYAIGFKSEKTNGSYRYVWLYKCRATPITENYATKEGDTVNRQTGTIEFTAIKRTYDGLYQAVADADAGYTGGDTFLATVYATA